MIGGIQRGVFCRFHLICETIDFFPERGPSQFDIALHLL